MNENVVRVTYRTKKGNIKRYYTFAPNCEAGLRNFNTKRPNGKMISVCSDSYRNFFN